MNNIQEEDLNFISKTENNEIDNESKNEYELLYQKAKKIRNMGIISFILFFSIFGTIASIILNIICAIQIGSTNWKNKEIENSKIAWVIFSIISVPFVYIFGSIAMKKIKRDNLNEF